LRPEQRQTLNFGKATNMTNYWRARYLQAIAKVEQAQSTRTRSAYADLALHYDAMHRLCERSPVGELRTAA
jgi:hypothetical protein